MREKKVFFLVIKANIFFYHFFIISNPTQKHLALLQNFLIFVEFADSIIFSKTNELNFLIFFFDILMRFIKLELSLFKVRCDENNRKIFFKKTNFYFSFFFKILIKEMQHSEWIMNNLVEISNLSNFKNFTFKQIQK
jgi:hypothetical protein